MATRPGPSNAIALGWSFASLGFFTASPDSRTAQPGNPVESLNTASSRWHCQQASQAATTLFVQRCQHSVYRPMLLGDRTSRMLTAGCTGAFVI
jgi:hypothetical protein